MYAHKHSPSTQHTCTCSRLHLNPQPHLPVGLLQLSLFGVVQLEPVDVSLQLLDVVHAGLEDRALVGASLAIRVGKSENIACARKRERGWGEREKWREVEEW